MKRIIVTRENLNDYFDAQKWALKVSANLVYKSNGGKEYNFAPVVVAGETYWSVDAPSFLIKRCGNKVRFCLNIKTGFFHYMGDSSYAGYTEDELALMDEK